MDPQTRLMLVLAVVLGFGGGICGDLVIRSVWPPKHLVTQRLTLIDDSGAERAAFEFHKGHVSLRMTDDKFRPRAELAVQDNGLTELGFTDDFGKARAKLSQETNGFTSLELSDENGKVRTALELAGGDTGLELRDRNGVRRAALELDNDNGQIALRDLKGNARVLLAAKDDGNPSGGFGLLDKNGKGRVVITVNGEDVVSVTVRDGAGKTVGKLP